MAGNRCCRRQINKLFRTGCKVVCLDEYGNLLNNATLMMHTGSRDDKTLARKKLSTLAEQYKVEETELTEKINIYLEENKDAIGSATKNIEKMTTTLDENRDELNRVFNNIANISDTIAQAHAGEAVRSLSSTSIRLDEIVKSLENGEGTLGKLVSSDSLYFDIDRTVNSLDKLLLDIREHPKRYVELSIFGGRKSVDKEK